MAACAGCSAEVTWLSNFDTGKRAPVDRKPTEGGNVKLVESAKGMQYKVLNAKQTREAIEAGISLYTLHFATCPKAEHFKRCGKCHKQPCACAPAPVQGSLL